MTEIKTKASKASVTKYVAAIDDEERRADCKRLIKLMTGITGKPATMWGPSIVGFDSYHYKYASGHEGDMCLTGFSSRKPNLSIYIEAAAGQARQAQGGQGLPVRAPPGGHRHGRAARTGGQLDRRGAPVLRKAWRLSFTRRSGTPPRAP
jgi:hypothetical protein